jgi:lysophospholipase L1-like esterase
MTRLFPAPRLLLTALLVALLCAASGCSQSSSSKPQASSSRSNVESDPPKQLKYVALGDSYTAAPLVPVTDVANGCFRSNSNYPSLAARKLGADLDDRSCGGATTRALRTAQHPDVPAQFSALSPSVDLVTIGMGGNDHGLFQQLVNRCPALRDRDPHGAPCQAAMTSGGGDRLLGILKRTGTQLTSALREIHTKAPKAKVLVVGYPEIVASGKVCDRLPLADGDYAYAAKINKALTEMVRSAAQASDSTYVDIYTASKGHDVCSADPWVNGRVNDQKRAAAYHPFAVEQKAVAGLVAAAASD